jgi:Uma2 family endonuclease
MMNRLPTTALPPLKNGDRLDQKAFHARYEAMPEHVRAELIGGIVYLSPPQKAPLGRMRVRVLHWLAEYEDVTPGIEALPHVTHILSEKTEVQPAVSLLIFPHKGGQTREMDDYIDGPPEFIVEIASSTDSIELHAKRDDYERAGVREYVVVALRQARVFWFILRNGQFENLAPGGDGIFRSEVFPGLWLDPVALLRRDAPRIREVLQQGLATPEHAAFVSRLAGQ